MRWRFTKGHFRFFLESIIEKSKNEYGKVKVHTKDKKKHPQTQGKIGKLELCIIFIVIECEPYTAI